MNVDSTPIPVASQNSLSCLLARTPDATVTRDDHGTFADLIRIERANP